MAVHLSHTGVGVASWACIWAFRSIIIIMAASIGIYGIPTYFVWSSIDDFGVVEIKPILKLANFNLNLLPYQQAGMPSYTHMTC